MKKEIALVNHWWIVLLRGIAAIIFALLAIFWPDFTLGFLILLLAIYLLVDGIVAIFTAFKAAEKHHKWWLFLVEGLVSLLVGVMILAWPGITAMLFVYLVAIWALLTGILEIWAALSGQFEFGGKLLLSIAGILSAIIGLILLLHPFEGILVLVWIIGLYALIFGIVLIALSFQLRKLSE